jgi:hypothetical protein
LRQEQSRSLPVSVKGRFSHFGFIIGAPGFACLRGDRDFMSLARERH